MPISALHASLYRPPTTGHADGTSQRRLEPVHARRQREKAAEPTYCTLRGTTAFCNKNHTLFSSRNVIIIKNLYTPRSIHFTLKTTLVLRAESWEIQQRHGHAEEVSFYLLRPLSSGVEIAKFFSGIIKVFVVVSAV